MSNNDTGLFELCKAVYEATKWKAGDWWYERTDPKSRVYLKLLGRPDIGFVLDEHDILVPLYTSDYLLKKLPKTIWSIYALVLQPGEHVTTAGYYEPDGQAGIEIDELQKCATTIEALLRLTLELHEEKLL